MRQLADRYRDLFPCLLIAVEVRGGRPYYGFVELTPTAEGPYEVQPGARSGTPQQNWLRELTDRLVVVPCLAWARHRDEGGGVLHYEGVVPTDGRTLVVAPPPGGGSGSDDCGFTIQGPGKLCIGPGVEIDFVGGGAPYKFLNQVCPVFLEIEPGAGIAIDQITPTLYRISATGGAGGGGMAIGGAIANGPVDGDVLAVGPGGVLAQYDSISGGSW